MDWISRIVTVCIVATWGFPLYFFAKDMLFGWNESFAHGIACGILLISIPGAIIARLRRRSARPKTELMAPDYEQTRSQEHWFRQKGRIS